VTPSTPSATLSKTEPMDGGWGRRLNVAHWLNPKGQPLSRKTNKKKWTAERTQYPRGGPQRQKKEVGVQGNRFQETKAKLKVVNEVIEEETLWTV